MSKTNVKKIVFFDLEMCCWDSKEKTIGEIIEFSLVEVDVDSLVVTQQAQYYVKPENDEISEFCTSLTGITPRMVNRQGRPLSEVLSSIEKKFGKNKTFMSWGSDDKVIRNECSEKGILFNFHSFVNFSVLFRLSHGISQISQVKAMSMYGIEFEGRQHSGLVDAQNLSKLGIEYFFRIRK